MAIFTNNHARELTEERRRVETDLKTARKKGDPNWILLKRKHMKLIQQEKIASFKVMTSRSKVKYSYLWYKKDETTLFRTAKKIYNFVTFPIRKAREYFKELRFPLIDVRSMYATERFQSVKRWLKRPELGIKMTYVTERRQELKKFREKFQKS